MKRRVTRTCLMLSCLLAAAACSPQEERMAGTAGGRAPDAAAEDRMIRMTGCVERGVEPGTYALASVASAGVTGTTGEPSSIGSKREAQERAATSYRLLTMDDEDLSRYLGNRVTVLGRLAADPPDTAGSSGSGATGSSGSTRPDDTTKSRPDPHGTTVTGEAPALRGFWVERVQKVSDTCEPSKR